MAPGGATGLGARRLLGGIAFGALGRVHATGPSRGADASAQGAGADAAWLQVVSSQIAAEEYHAAQTEDGLQAPNRAQNLRTHFRETGIEIRPRQQEGAATWRFAWRTASVGRQGRMRDVAPPSGRERPAPGSSIPIRASTNGTRTSPKDSSRASRFTSDPRAARSFVCKVGSKACRAWSFGTTARSTSSTSTRCACSGTRS